MRSGGVFARSNDCLFLRCAAICRQRLSPRARSSARRAKAQSGVAHTHTNMCTVAGALSHCTAFEPESGCWRFPAEHKILFVLVECITSVLQEVTYFVSGRKLTRNIKLISN